MKLLKFKIRTLPSIHKTYFDREGKIVVYVDSQFKTLTPIFAALARAHNERLDMTSKAVKS